MWSDYELKGWPISFRIELDLQVYDRVQSLMVAKLPSQDPADPRLSTVQYAIAGGFAGAASSLVYLSFLCDISARSH